VSQAGINLMMLLVHHERQTEKVQEVKLEDMDKRMREGRSPSHSSRCLTPWRWIRGGLAPLQRWDGYAISRPANSGS